MLRDSRDPEPLERWTFAGLVAAVLIAAIVAAIMQSCATVDAVVSAPESFWITVDAILAAMVEDVMDLIDLFL